MRNLGLQPKVNLLSCSPWSGMTEAQTSPRKTGTLQLRQEAETSRQPPSPLHLHMASLLAGMPRILHSPLVSLLVGTPSPPLSLHMGSLLGATHSLSPAMRSSHHHHSLRAMVTLLLDLLQVTLR
jgi:hypothetical protein